MLLECTHVEVPSSLVDVRHQQLQKVEALKLKASECRRFIKACLTQSDHLLMRLAGTTR
jgi:hypothetical protein